MTGGIKGTKKNTYSSLKTLERYKPEKIHTKGWKRKLREEMQEAAVLEEEDEKPCWTLDRPMGFKVKYRR
jgi:hypothetical protein